MAPLRSYLGISIGAALLGGVAWLMASVDGPWDRSSNGRGGPAQPRDDLAIRVGMDRSELPKPDWVAKQVSIGIRSDVRREGLTINHRVLELRDAEWPERILPSSATLVYTPSYEMEGRVNAVLSGDVPVNPGMESLFAIGRLVEGRLVRLDGRGRVSSIEDVRVSFVSVTRPLTQGEH
ncbi:MAG: hypothetical protein JNL80_00310 [Phycisphaerae bacterium]|nr:hypothetical protein [Phycisphaerae bacterium]